MVQLFVMRHAPTAYNREKKFMGSTIDISIEEESVNLLKDLRDQIQKEYIVDLCLISPLKRARETAELLFDCPIIENSLIIERSIGDLAGLSVEEVKKCCPEVIDENGHYRYIITPPNGESIESAVRRVVKFLDEVVSKYEEKNIAIITHGGIVQLIDKMINLVSIESVLPNTKEYLSVRQYTMSKELLGKIKVCYERYLEKML